MKFEIDEKEYEIDNGLLVTPNILLPTLPPKRQLIKTEEIYQILQYLETMSQAVKKTQTKLINKDIQEIQDSKREGVKTHVIDARITLEDINKNKVTFTKKHIESIILVDDSQNIYQAKPLEEIEQNQKIVERLHESINNNTKDTVWTVSGLKSILKGPPYNKG